MRSRGRITSGSVNEGHIMSILPSTLFKYEGFNTYSLQNLKAQSVYFGSPLNFNDPYDCAITGIFAEPTHEELEAIRGAYNAKADVPDDIKDTLTAMTEDELAAWMQKIAEGATADERKKFAATKGITCFSEINDDLLMWSHYGGQYKGFCLEFRTTGEMFGKVRKVRYMDSMPVLNIADAIVNNNYEQIIDLYCTKSTAWRHEHEWRAIHNQAGTLFTYEADTLKAVYFGPDIDQHAREIVCLILAGQNPDVELWQGKRSATKFKVEFDRFTYMPYIEAKKKGLR
jgi:hypothetical protein